MHALPMTTPSVVKNARILFAQRASSATIQVSLRGIMWISVNDHNPRWETTRTQNMASSAPFTLPLFFLHPLQLFFHSLIMGIEGKRKPVFFRRFGKSPQGFVQFSQPFSRG